MSRRTLLHKSLGLGALVVVVVVLLLPVVNMIGSSFKSRREILTLNGLFPHHWVVSNYVNVFRQTPFTTYAGNSVLVAVTVTIYATVIASFAGYSLARFARKLKPLRFYSNMLLVLQMFPLVLVLIPLFAIFRNLGIYNTRGSLIIAYGAMVLPFSIWMLEGFFTTIPQELEQSAMIDGCTQFQAFIRIVLPISGPGVSAVAIFTFINCWNEYLMASILLRSDWLRTLPVGLQNFIQEYNVEWGQLMAASTATIVPVAFFLIFMQKYIVQGLTAGAVKA